MSYQLAYKDRYSLIESFEELRKLHPSTDNELIFFIEEWLANLDNTSGIKLGLAKDIASISLYLHQHSEDDSIAPIARGAFHTVSKVILGSSTHSSDLIQFSCAFICNYAVNEIRGRLGIPVTYTAPQLDENIKKRAENLFLEFTEETTQTSQELIELSRETIKDLKDLSSCGFFMRLTKNIQYLIQVLSETDRSLEQKVICRAALKYLIFEEDAIPDSLGIIGYIDDNFIAQLAVDLIDPGRNPWVELLDEAVEAWPFLNHLVFDDNLGSRPISEYAIINSIFTCTQKKPPDFPSSMELVLPITGLTPFLLGFISVLGLVHESDNSDEEEVSFVVGQKIMCIENRSVTEFAGYEDIDGRKMFRMKTRNGTRYWPISDLSRFVSADESRKIGGRRLIQDQTRIEGSISPLDQLFATERADRFSSIKKYTVVVMPVVRAKEEAKRLKLYKKQVNDIIPMGHLTGSGEIKKWSTCFGEKEPLLIFISDLDEVPHFIKEHPDNIANIIIDKTGRNANKMANLAAIKRSNTPTIVISPERTCNEEGVIVDENSGLWEWNNNDFSELLWPEEKYHDSRLANYEKRLNILTSSPPIVKHIQLPLTETAFEAVNKIHEKVKSRKQSDNQLYELDDILSNAFDVMFRLLRFPGFLTTNSPSYEVIKKNLEKIQMTSRNSLYLSSDEQEDIEKTHELLGKLFLELQQNNPKARAIEMLLENNPNLSIVCPDSRIFSDLKVYADRGIKIINEAIIYDDVGGGIISGWFSKKRMAEFLVPPAFKPLYLLLFDIELKWYNALQTNRIKEANKRQIESTREKIFPKIKGWKKPKPIPTQTGYTGATSRLEDLETLSESIKRSHLEQIYNKSRATENEKSINAFLILFESGEYAFLTEFYKISTVTHLFENAVEETDDDETVKQKTVKELSQGDAILFHRGIDSDVIRMIADTKFLEADVRHTSSLWRTALLNYCKTKNLRIDELWSQLRECRLSTTTKYY